MRHGTLSKWACKPPLNRRTIQAAYAIGVMIILIVVALCTSTYNLAHAGTTTPASGPGWSLDDSGHLTISGALAKWYSSSNERPGYGQTSQITSVTISAGASAKTCSYMFGNMRNLTTITGLSNLNTSAVTDMGEMFKGCQNLKELDLRGLDTSKVTSFRAMFYGCNKLTSLNITGLNTSAATDMSGMFGFCEELPQLDVSGLDTSKVQNFSGMFCSCRSLVSLDVSRWNTSQATNMSSMFRFNLSSEYSTSPSGTCLKTMDLSNWNVSNVKYMGAMFDGASLLEPQDFSRWNVSKVESMSEMFDDLSWTTDQYQSIKNWNVKAAANKKAMFQRNSNIVNVNFLSNWDMSGTQDIAYMLYGCTALEDISGVGNWNVSSVTTMERTFSRTAIQNLNALRNWNVKKATCKADMFNYDEKLTNIEALANWDMSGTQTIAGMFYYCDSLADITSISGWNVSSVSNMTATFAHTAIANLDALRNWNVSHVQAFGGAISTSVYDDQHPLDSVNGHDAGMFCGCKSLTDVSGISGWNTAAARSLAGMFQQCSGLTVIDLHKWNTEKVYTFDQMFNECTALENLNIASFNTHAVTGELTNFFNTSRGLSEMFGSTPKLKRVVLGANFSFGGNSTEVRYTNLPTPPKTGGYIGKWQNETTGVTYLPNEIPHNTAATYVWAEGTLTYTITYNLNGGQADPNFSNQTKQATQAISLHAGTPVKGAVSVSTTVQANANGGKFADGSTMKELGISAGTDFVFTHWLGTDGKTYSPGQSYTSDADITLTAQWQQNPISHTEVCPSVSRDGYTLLGFYTAATGGDYVCKPGDVISRTDIQALYAHWEEIPIPTYTITYDANDFGRIGEGESRMTVEALAGSYLIPELVMTPIDPAVSTRSLALDACGGALPENCPDSVEVTRTTTYAFENWNTAKDGSGNSFPVGSSMPLDGNVTLYAQWAVTEGATMPPLPVPERNGFTFDGWYDAASEGARIGQGGDTPVDYAGEILYAHWTPIPETPVVPTPTEPTVPKPTTPASQNVAEPVNATPQTTQAKQPALVQTDAEIPIWMFALLGCAIVSWLIIRQIGKPLRQGI